MGMVFDRESWSSLTSCAEVFCTYDDYNWDWSLQHVSQSCMSQPIRAVVASTARVFHMGECGVHHKTCSSSNSKVQERVMQVLNKSAEYLFPTSVSLIKTTNRNTRMPKVNGGWSDKRDHILCLSHLDQSMKPPVHHHLGSNHKAAITSYTNGT